MRITHLGHACLLVEVADQRLLFDPGNFADEEMAGVRDLDAIVITHQHPDHLDVDRVPDLVRANPEAEILCDPMSVEALAKLGIEGRDHAGSQTRIGEVTLTPYGQMHAVIHDDIPRITNTGVLVTADGEPRLFHPGDALDAEPGEVDVLAFPLNAPWQASKEMVAFLRRLKAPTAVPIHDGLVQPRGRAIYLKQAKDLGPSETTVLDLAGKGATEVG